MLIKSVRYFLVFLFYILELEGDTFVSSLNNRRQTDGYSSPAIPIHTHLNARCDFALYFIFRHLWKENLLKC